jgi:hypothetical protein
MRGGANICKFETVIQNGQNIELHRERMQRERSLEGCKEAD